MTPVLDAVRREELRKRATAALVRGWKCPSCGCFTFTRVDEIGPHGFEPGDDVRCNSCKHVSYWPRYNETADTTLALLAYIAELEAGLRPFAEAADSLDEHRRDTSEIWEDPAAMAITAGDLRRAAALLPKASVRDERPSDALADVAAERERQKSVEGWTAEHDDKHSHGEMSDAAVCYAIARPLSSFRNEIAHRLWPWDREWWKPTDRRRNLVKAGALILAEIERLDRALLNDINRKPTPEGK